MILITGAAGKTGQAVIRELVRQGLRLYARLVHRPEQIRSVEELGAHEVQVGDMHDQASMDQAVRGVKAIYHIPPNVSPDEIVIGRDFDRCCPGLLKLITSSTTRCYTHRQRACRIIGRNCAWKSTYLNPDFHSRSFSPQSTCRTFSHIGNKSASQGIYTVPYAAETRLSMVDLQDVAQVAALVLTETGTRRRNL